MASILIRNLSDSDVLKLDEMAAKKKISREELLRKFIKQIVLNNEITNAEDRYRNLVEVVIDRLEENNQLMVQLEEAVKNVLMEENYGG